MGTNIELSERDKRDIQESHKARMREAKLWKPLPGVERADDPFSCQECGAQLRDKELGSVHRPICFKCEDEISGPAGICVGCGCDTSRTAFNFCEACV